MICGVSDGIVRTVYRIGAGTWQSVRAENGRLRRGCDGTRDDQQWDRLVGAGVRTYLPATHQNAVRYLWGGQTLEERRPVPGTGRRCQAPVTT
jgi:hypothetical protein